MAWWGLLLLGGCAGQVKAEARAGGTVTTSDDRRWEAPEKGEPAPPAPAASPPALAAAPPASTGGHFIGVSHDLSLAEGAGTTAVCTCLGVAYGAPSDPKFAWHGGAPTASPDTMAVAIRGDVSCPAHAGGHDRGPPSISGLARQGDDVVVFVEAARGGRPVVSGAIVERPGPKGGIVIKTRGRLPFGGPLGGGRGTCRIAVSPG
jgi:hypothetical protein